MNWNAEKELDEYIPLVRLVVTQMKKRLSDKADESELFSFGMTGLWDAGLKFNPGQGVKFETYAVQRIRGEILDGLRQTDHVSRTLRTKEKKIRKAVEELEQVYLRRPTTSEVSTHLGMSKAEYEQTQMQLSFINQDSLNEPLDQEEASPVKQIEDTNTLRQDEWLETKERKKALASFIDALPEREKLTLALVYYENLTLTDVSVVLGVHKSRASQLHQQALKRLRKQMEQQGFEW
ncbi:FliA/WhiG family RNA polymerase sigma factor [Neobacillus notoginsengisoli]|uniref:FliA/WhiG family RNA polymerase sigma factor n=1 Tax=Neobacillus notoginsengisoli TaxID=1578198 RepID=A0A417YJU7_9BACI|nr:FliA/WhiG family RNA polymerase sigma factor [Neobacillus notoginsengisoli]RHW33295.1 FliA/WhiG family RNA polymerase sigma factor [Neobacillus notoginsengisoli]